MSILSPHLSKELLPQEERLEVSKKKGKLFIGIPKEDFSFERRVPLSPDAVQMLVNNGHRVLIEKDAGMGANYSDREYSEAGAEISTDKKRVFACGWVVKITPPTQDEIEIMAPNSILFSSLQIKTKQSAYIQKLEQKKITAMALEFIQDTHENYPFLTPISEIAGVACIHIAAELMSNHTNGKGLLFGNISGVLATEVVILGAGVVGEYAAKTALGLGAQVKIFDNSTHRLKRIQRLLPQQVSTSTIQEKTLKKALMRCDVAIGAIRGNQRAPMVVPEEMVQKMKKGAVIIDAAIDQGGCFETSELKCNQQPIFTKYDVLHFCVPNIASRYSKTASLAISNVLSNVLIDISEQGGFEEKVAKDIYFRNGLYLYKGILVNEVVGNWYNLPFKDINLLFL